MNSPIKAFAGIDPGIRGGVAIVDENGQLLKAHPMPIRTDPKTKQSCVHTWQLANLLTTQYNTAWSPIALTIVEEQQIRGNQGHAIIIGANYGRILGQLEYMALPYELRRPKQWLTHFQLGADKTTHIAKAQELGYDVPPLRPKGTKPHDGIADAILIALYAKHLWQKRQTNQTNSPK